MTKQVERCQNCSMPIAYDASRGWRHQASGMKLCQNGAGSIRPRKGAKP
jgi:hypothetical protein